VATTGPDLGAGAEPSGKRPAEPRGGGPIPWRIWRLAWVIVLGAFASGLDTSLVNVGLRTIGTDLHAGLVVVQWTATGYLLALAGSLPLAGWLGTRLGAGRVWLGALGLFTVASGACALAPSIAALIALRVAQGLAGGLLIPAGQTVLGQAGGRPSARSSAGSCCRQEAGGGCS
jgi:MFS family permease